MENTNFNLQLQIIREFHKPSSEKKRGRMEMVNFMEVRSANDNRWWWQGARKRHSASQPIFFVAVFASLVSAVSRVRHQIKTLLNVSQITKTTTTATTCRATDEDGDEDTI